MLLHILLQHVEKLQVQVAMVELLLVQWQALGIQLQQVVAINLEQ